MKLTLARTGNERAGVSPQRRSAIRQDAPADAGHCQKEQRCCDPVLCDRQISPLHVSRPTCSRSPQTFFSFFFFFLLLFFFPTQKKQVHVLIHPRSLSGIFFSSALQFAIWTRSRSFTDPGVATRTGGLQPPRKWYPIQGAKPQEECALTPLSP
jgi:hypothetical protein